jgi:hypothetical protein
MKGKSPRGRPRLKWGNIIMVFKNGDEVLWTEFMWPTMGTSGVSCNTVMKLQTLFLDLLILSFNYIVLKIRL